MACFQPHLYSRTRHLARDFGRALALADVAVVLDVYPARERRGGLPRRQRLARRGGDGGRRGRAAGLLGAGRWSDAERLLRAELREGDALLTLGAGDVDALARARSTRALGRTCGRAGGRKPPPSERAGRRAPAHPCFTPDTDRLAADQAVAQPAHAAAAAARRRSWRSLLGSLYQFWFRDSALVAVNEVEVTGLTTKDAPRIQRDAHRGRRGDDHAAHPRGRARGGGPRVPDRRLDPRRERLPAWPADRGRGAARGRPRLGRRRSRARRRRRDGPARPPAARGPRPGADGEADRRTAA